MEKELLEEKWLPIKNYEGIYEISNYGKIKSLERIVNGRWGAVKVKEKILKQASDKDGYLLVTLCKNGKQKTQKVHRLVAKAFVDNPDNLPQVNHIDENKKNNFANNLEFCTNKYNFNYGTAIERRIKKINKSVLQFDLNNNFLKKYESIKQATNEIKNSHISDCCNGKLKTCGGYIWRYENEKRIN